MIIQPKTLYSGLTVVIDKPSRNDGDGLIGGYAGQFFDSCLLADPKYSVYRANIEVRTLDECDLRPFAPATKTLLLLGEKSSQRFCPLTTLGEQRGSPFAYNGMTCISTFAPQDAFDRKQYFTDDGDVGETSDAEDTDNGKSTHGKTQRKNWKFWLRQDIRKIVRLTREPWIVSEPAYHFYPDAEEVIRLLETTRGQDFYFDIETDGSLQLTCFGFSFGDGHVWVVPMLQTYLEPRKYYYEPTIVARLLRALAIALNNNVVVIHNSMFDLFVLAYRYRLPIGLRVFDTMLSHNRCYIEVEKSLGHVISLHTDLPYHKNEGVFEPHNSAQTDMLYKYNGKDVYAMTLLKPAIEARAALLGATESVQQVNRMVVPYLVASLQGMSVNWEKVESIVTKNERMKLQINRILSILTGKEEFNANSWQQVAKYLYDEVGLKKPEKDLTNEKTLLQHQLKGEIGAITAILEYRKLTKQSSKVSFNPYTGLWGETRKLFTTNYNLAGTTTMRLSARKLTVGFDSEKQGDNSQNFEKALRKIIVPTDYEPNHLSCVG